MRVLITGSSGQIGTNLALRCIDDGHRVLGIDCRANPWTDAFEYALCDLGEIDADKASLQPFGHPAWPRPDVVVHLAAHAKVHDLVQEPRRAHANTAITQNVLEHCRRLQVPIVYASSREVYGNVVRATAKEGDAAISDAASAYAASKIASEAMIHAYARCYGLAYLVFRLSNVYGRYDNDLHRMQRVVPLFIDRIGDDAPVTVFGADKLLDFTYIDDCVDGLMGGIERMVDGRVRNRTFNIAYGEGHSLLELADCVGEALGRTPRVTVLPSRTGEVTRYVADLEQARELLDFSPKVALREGIRRAAVWGDEWARRRSPVGRAAGAS